jgi:orotate phosphoribosyltransferase
MFTERVRPNVDRIAGAELGAVPLAAVTSIHCGKPCVFIRNQKKEYGTSKLVEGVLNPGETVMIVEDVLTTGGQVLESCKVLSELGVKIDRIVGVIDRMEGARENIEGAGYVFETLFTVTDLGIEK